MRYDRNRETITAEDNGLLARKRVCIVGAGGLGGYVLEMLGRIGVGRITLIDGDVFDDTNLNRQILSSESVLGLAKVEVARRRLFDVNPLVDVDARQVFLEADNAEALLSGHDVIVDALDAIDTRFLVMEEAERLGIPLVHGAIAGWYGQVTTILPGDRTLEHLYRNREKKGVEERLGNLSFPPATVASIEVAETVKLLLSRGETLSRRILFIDLLMQDYHVFEIS